MPSEFALFDLEDMTNAPDLGESLYKEIVDAYELEESTIRIGYLLDKVTSASPINFRERGFTFPVHKSQFE